MQAHFEFRRLSPDGAVIGIPVKVNTAAGVFMQCPAEMDRLYVEHLCGIARLHADYPVDLTLWRGLEGSRYIAWAARIIWRN